MASSRSAVTASASKPKPATSGKLDSITIEPTDNGGVIVSTSRRSTAKGHDYPTYQPPTRNAFATPDEALAHVKGTLGEK